jgi:poly(A) polymerase
MTGARDRGAERHDPGAETRDRGARSRDRGGGAAPPDPLDAARDALAGREAWLVGGAVRDRLLGRPTDDVDVALAGDPRRAARAIAKATGGAAFRLSGAFGAWRVVGPGHSWHVDLVPLRDADIAADLAARDFTINAMAQPLAGGGVLDPHGGRADLEARRVRMVSEAALAADPLRTLRAVRLATELSLEIEPATRRAAAAHAPEIERVAPERVFAELKRIVTADRAREGLAAMEDLDLMRAVLPELTTLHGVQQNEFHHADVFDHTLEVLDAVQQLERDPWVADLLAEPLADDLTRGGGMRFAALLHDAAKPQTRGVRPDGRVTFIGHDAAGAALARDVLRRLRASQRLVEYVAALTLHHLRLGFLVHERPLSRRSVWRYLRATEPYSADVTIFTVADRLATRGRNADAAIAVHVELAREMLDHALAERAAAPQPPLVRGDELARALDLPPGPRLGELLAQLEEDRYVGDIATKDDAVRRARELLRTG